MARVPLVGGIGFAIEAVDDKFIQQLRKAGERGRRELQGVTTEADRLGDEMKQAGAQGERAMRGLESRVDKVGDQMRRAQGSANALRNTVSGLALGAVFVSGARTLAEFGQALSTVQAVTGATGGQLSALEAKAKSLGATTRFSATQAAEGMIFLARAGFNSEQVLGSIEATLQLAQAGALDLGSAADIASNILQGFQLDVSETGRLVDIMAKAANSSNTDIRQLGDAMKYAAPVAAGLGVSVEETAATISALSDAGLQATLAGTGVRKALVSLEAPTTKGAAALKRLKIDLESVRPSAVGLTNAFRQLRDAGAGTVDLKDIFGVYGLAASQVLVDSVEKVDRLTKAYQEAEGTAAKMARTMDDNLNGALLATKSRLEALILALGDAGAETALITALEGLQDLLKLAAENADVVQAAFVALAIRAVLPLAIAVGTNAVGSVVALYTQLVVLNAIAARTTTALQVTTVAARGALVALGPLTIGIALAAAAYVALARDTEKTERALARASSAIDKYQSALLEIEGDTRELRKANESLTRAITDQAVAAELTARREIAAIEKRIEANERLVDAQLDTITSSKRKAAEGIAQDRAALGDALVIDPKTVAAGIRASGGQVNMADLVDTRSLDQVIDDFQDKLRRKRASGEEVSSRDEAINERINALRENEQALKDLQAQETAVDARRRERLQRQRAEARDFRQGIDFGGTGTNRMPSFDAPILLGEDEQARVEEELDKINRLRQDITDAELLGRLDIVKARKEELAVSEKIVELLESGKSIEFAQDAAKDPKAGDKTVAKEANEAAAAVKKLDGEWQAAYATRREQVETWKNAELAAVDALKISDAERGRRKQQILDLEQERLDQIEIDELTAENEAYNAEIKRARAIEDTIRARDLELAIQIAQLKGDEDGLKALEEKRDLQQRINELLEQGLSITDAITRAEYEVAAIKGATASEAMQARKEFVDGLAGDIQSGLSNAVRSGDYGNIFQEVINSAAARGLEDAIANLADSLANLFGNIVLGSDGTGGIVGDLFKSGGGLGGAADLATDTADTAAQAAATAAVTAFGGAATGAAASTGALATGQAAAAAAAQASALAMGAVAAAAQIAAAALASVSASSGASTAVAALSFGGGRAHGGPVSPGKFYEVNEGGIAEMLKIGSKSFLLPGAAGAVEPLTGSRLSPAQSREVARVEIYAHGTGNEELDRLMTGAVNRAVRIARTQAGPAAAEFQTRKV